MLIKKNILNILQTIPSVWLFYSNVNLDTFFISSLIKINKINEENAFNENTSAVN